LAGGDIVYNIPLVVDYNTGEAKRHKHDAHQSMQPGEGLF